MSCCKCASLVLASPFRIFFFALFFCSNQTTNEKVSGVADYVDDIPAPPGTLHAAPILATVPHAYLRGVDVSGAYALNEAPKGAFGLDDGKVSEGMGRTDVKSGLQ